MTGILQGLLVKPQVLNIATPRLAPAVGFTVFLLTFGWNDRSQGRVKRLVMQTKTTIQFQQYYNALLDLLFPQQ
tara:strand:- start:2035 stop:2256 length:222 start_codon:yes stop_codon:yes gene_type:complete